MSGIIKLLPEHVANQIAAGEVVERPSSVVKELLENSIDAGATSITLLVKQAGKTLVEVTDNGKGMSPMDARMCFERHATSKIQTVDDLFCLKTMGFRGEALASIASVAQVELFTRPQDHPLGTHLVLEGGKLILSENCTCAPGTQMRVKNLFFNIPARRQFLKEDSTELNHIFSEFERVALAQPTVKMEMFSHTNLVYSIPAGNYFHRIEALFGKQLSRTLIFFEENTEIVSVKGYVTSPAHAIKKKKNHFFFVNNRFIRSPYFTRAVYDAFQGLIPSNAYPQFFIYFQVDPSTVDVNIHPTKTEVKFRDEREIYAILQSAIRRAIGKNVLSAELDFQTPSFIQESIYAPALSSTTQAEKHSNVNPDTGRKFVGPSGHSDPQWKELYAIFEKENTPDLSKDISVPLFETASSSNVTIPEYVDEVLPVYNKYILLVSGISLYLADRQRLHERVLFEDVLKKYREKRGLAIQQLLIPEELEADRRDVNWIKENKVNLFMLGFDLQEFGKDSFLIQGIPSGVPIENAGRALEELIEHVKLQSMDEHNPLEIQMARGFCRTFSLKAGMPATKDDLLFLVHSWLKTENPSISPWGKPVVKFLEPEHFEFLFRK